MTDDLLMMRVTRTGNRDADKAQRENAMADHVVWLFSHRVT